MSSENQRIKYFSSESFTFYKRKRNESHCHGHKQIQENNDELEWKSTENRV